MNYKIIWNPEKNSSDCVGEKAIFIECKFDPVEILVSIQFRAEDLIMNEILPTCKELVEDLQKRKELKVLEEIPREFIIKNLYWEREDRIGIDTIQKVSAEISDEYIISKYKDHRSIQDLIANK